MNEMIERVAQALHAAARTGVAWEELAAQAKALPLELARAAIEAMREPTIAMVEAAKDGDGGDWGESFSPLPHDDAWRAMIDAALKE